MNKYLQFFLLSVIFLAPMHLFAQGKTVTVSGKIQDNLTKNALAYANVILKTEKDKTFVKAVLTAATPWISASKKVFKRVKAICF